MNHIEQMKSWLETLEMARRFVYSDNRPQCDDAITTLRTAIEQIEKREPVCPNKVCWTPYDCDDGCKSLKNCAIPPAAPVQVQTDWEAVAADQAMTIALLKSEAAAQPAQEEIQRLSALVRAQQITIEKLEAQSESK